MYAYNLGLRFQSVAAEYSERAAVCFSPAEQVTYGQLNSAANQLARYLIDKGVKTADVVCLSGEKSPFAFACIIACLKIGAIYTLLDPESPEERLRKILFTCRPRVLVADDQFLARAKPLADDLEFTSMPSKSAQLTQTLNEFDDTNLAETNAITGSDPAYIMFTSGSTGIPKGAVMTHGNVLNLIEWSKNTFGITPEEILTNVNPLYFDNSVFDLYSALFNGACLVPFTGEEVKDPKQLVEKADAMGCTSWFSVPSLLIFLQTMKAMDGENLRSIRRFIFGGEGYPKAKLKDLYEKYHSSSAIFNVYGPTECTCICSAYRVSAADFVDLQGLPPLGQIAENFGFLILDDESKRVAPGEIGELCLHGPNVGKGYYNDPERTAISFPQNPYNQSFPEVIYRTGDLVRLEPADGKLYIHGRKDNQIKHMGYRIELEEIEAALHCLDYLSEAVALHSTFNGFSRIVAVVASGDAIDAERIRSDVRRFIPSYMIPSVFYREEVLPKNANGKIDRKYLSDKYLNSKTGRTSA